MTATDTPATTPRSAPQTPAAAPLWCALLDELARQHAYSAPVAPVLALADEAARRGLGSAEQVALAFAAERIHSNRETFVGLAAINARLLEYSGEALDATVDARLRYWPLLGRYLARLFSGVTDPPLHADARALRSAISTGPLAGDPACAPVRLTIARHLLGYANLTVDDALLIELNAIATEACAHPATSADAKALWWGERVVIAAITWCRSGQDRPAIEALFAECEAFLAQHPQRDVQFKLARARLDVASTALDAAGRDAALRAMRDCIQPGKLLNQLQYFRCKGYASLTIGAAVDAEHELRQGLKLAAEIAAPPPFRLALGQLLGQVLLQQGRLTEAAEQLHDVRQFAPPEQEHFVDAMRLLVEALAAWDEQRERALTALRAGFALYRQTGRVFFLQNHPALASLTAARALAHDIEPGFVIEAIRRREMPPPDRLTSAWPWAVRLRLFGGFAMERPGADNERRQRGKTPAKPIAILRALALLGPRGGDRRALARRVWRGEDPESVVDALEMGIGRARKLLGDDSLIRVHDGRIFLDDKRVFVDIWAFDDIERLLQDAGQTPRSRVALEDLGRQLIALYAGRLFDDDDAIAASAVVIEQFRERFITMMTQLSTLLAQHDPRGGSALLQRAIEREPYSEQLYRALIGQLASAGEYAEAMRWYRRCQHAVSQAYGVAVSPNTDALLSLIRMPPPTGPVEH